MGKHKHQFSNHIFQGYVLAGGKSRRMGTDKRFLEFGGVTFLERAVNSLSTVCKDVKIVLNDSKIEPKINELLPEIKCLHDVFTNRGALGGIHSALQDCEAEFAIILACDLPFVDAAVIEKLAAYVDPNVSAIVPQQPDGRFQTLCAIYRKDTCLAKLETLFETQDSVSVRDLIEAVSHKIVASKKLSDLSDVFLNVNETNDLQALSRSDSY